MGIEKIVIPKKFEAPLRRRFDIKNFKCGVNNTPCPLCLEYGPYCKGCPFSEFKQRTASPGCVAWQESLVGTSFGGFKRILLYPHEVKSFKEFVKLAENLVEFRGD